MCECVCTACVHVSGVIRTHYRLSGSIKIIVVCGKKHQYIGDASKTVCDLRRLALLYNKVCKFESSTLHVDVVPEEARRACAWK